MAVAEELNFTRAADRLHMAQPPLSAAIRGLERELGTKLLILTSREVRLTDAGVTFLAGARRVTDEIEHTVHATRRTAAGELGSLRLAFSCPTGFETLPMLGRALRARHPDITLLTEEMWTANVSTALRSGRVDAALCTCPERSRDLVCETIRREPIVAVLPEAHRLAERSGLALGELCDDQFVLVAREVAPRLHDALVAACRYAGFEPRLRSGGLQSAWELEVLGECGLVSLGPESVSLALPVGLAAVPVTDPEHWIETAILVRADETSAIVGVLRDVARNLFTEAVLLGSASRLKVSAHCALRSS
jgi:DNA-binding transcriptional LysR family regulator